MFIAYRRTRGQAPSERYVQRQCLLNRLENVTFIVRNLIPSQKLHIFLLKWLATMVVLLVPNLIDHCV